MTPTANGRAEALTVTWTASNGIPGTAATPGTEEVSFREACIRLGMSEKTLRDRIAEGRVTARKVPEGARDVWRVQVPVEIRHSPESVPGVPPDAADTADSPGIEPEPTQERASFLSLEYRELLDRHEAACVRLGFLQSREDRVPALEAAANSLTERAATAEQRDRDARAELARLSQRIRLLLALLAVAGGLLVAVVGMLIPRLSATTGGRVDLPRVGEGPSGAAGPTADGSPSTRPYTASRSSRPLATPRATPSGAPAATGPRTLPAPR